jgi:uracil-DNA glycosylase family protein
MGTQPSLWDEPAAGEVVQDIEQLGREAAGCRNCELWRDATQTVFGEGPSPAPMMMVGEQPGDQEDRAGRPFVGPAGHVLDEALERAGIDRSQVYLTNAVKHFKWEARGKRRIHKTPSQIEIIACQPWFAAQLRAVQPRVLVLLGAVAAKSVMGRSFRVTTQRGTPLEGPAGSTVVATVHPSSILRGEPEDRKARTGELVSDLVKARELLDDG